MFVRFPVYAEAVAVKLLPVSIFLFLFMCSFSNLKYGSGFFSTSINIFNSLLVLLFMFVQSIDLRLFFIVMFWLYFNLGVNCFLFRLFVSILSFIIFSFWSSIQYSIRKLYSLLVRL